MARGHPLEGFVVLVVEDEADTLDAVTDLIRTAFGCSVIPAASGVEALKIIDSGRVVDLVLSDVVMPVMDGLRLSDELRKRLPVPIVLATGLTDALTLAIDHGAIALPKPYTLEDLERVFLERLGIAPTT